jgi:dienelactone hydrolase
MMPPGCKTFLAVALALAALQLRAQDPPPRWDRDHTKAISELALRWWKARPETRFAAWDPEIRRQLEEEARGLGALPEGKLDEALKLLWKPVRRHGPRGKGGSKATIQTPYGEAWYYVKGAGRNRGLVLGLHGGGEGAGSADEAAGKWRAAKCMAMFPQGIRLVHDTWNTVHGERFLLTLIEIAKAQYEIDPDRVYSMGFSMGGTGSWFLAGRHPDLLAGSSPCAGVLMARPKSQLATKEEVEAIQHGIVPNVRNLAMYYYIGLADRNCMPGTYLYVADLLDELREMDPTGYRKIRFQTYPGLAHAFPAGEPAKGIKWLEKQTRDTFPENLVWEYASHPFPKPDDEDLCTRIQKHFFYWIHCAEPWDRQTIRARRDGNTFHLEVDGTQNGVKGITILLNDRMIDPAKDVVVMHEGRELYRGRPRPDLWTLLETLDAKLDRSMVFDRRVEL